MFRLFECCALSFFERFVLSFSLKIERFVSDSAEIWICGLYHLANINKDKPIYYIIKAIYSHKSTNWEYKHINHKKKFVFYLRLR